MAIPINEIKYWDSGTPYGGVQGALNTSNVLGEMKYWDAGMPYVYVFPTVAASTDPVPFTNPNLKALLTMGVGT